jgi:plasmid stabilization system protein ParE
MAEVIWTGPALAQLGAIIEFIALDKPEAAEAVVHRVFSATDNLKSFLRLGRMVPEFPHEDYRQVWSKPCWLYYRIESEKAVLLHVRRADHFFHPDELLSDQT